MRVALTAVATLALMGCNFADTDTNETSDETTVADASARDVNLADSMASDDPEPLAATGDDAMFADPMAPAAASSDAASDKAGAASSSQTGKFPMMQAQVVLDRLGFSPGVVDGQDGLSTEHALLGYQEAKQLQVSGKLDEATRRALAPYRNIAPTRQVTIPSEWSRIAFQKVPESPEEQAGMERLGYNDMREKLAERFHTTPETLTALNNGKQEFVAGDRIRVPNVGGDRLADGRIDDQAWMQTLQSLGVGSEQPKVDRIVVDKSDGVLRAFDGSGKLVAQYTATMGSENDPLPLGDWKILGNAYNPPFSYNPELFWDVSDSDEKLQLPPGPNGPVGVVWIDLSKEHYGIHGTPEPQTIGRAQSHGCIRLTNWDAARLAQMIHSGTEAHFQA